MRAVKAYLLAYNGLQFFGWSAVLWATFRGLLSQKESVYQAAATPVRLCQGAAILEVVHALTGVVRGSPATAFLQWFGRSNVLFATLGCIKEVQSGWPVPALFASWAASEVIRYPWYVAAQFGEPPAFLTWLRYTMFIPLYPVGIASEVAIIYNSLAFMRDRRLHSIELPNPFNFGFSYHAFSLFGLVVLYPLAFPWLFTTLLRQRRKKLGKGAKFA